jgi:hypothetical protein
VGGNIEQGESMLAQMVDQLAARSVCLAGLLRAEHG